MAVDQIVKKETQRRARPYVRAVIAQARGGKGGGAIEYARNNFSTDRDLMNLLTRGAVTPTATTTTNVPTSTAIENLVPLLGPASASGNIFKQSLSLDFGQASAISVPEITASGAGVAFIGQGGAFPIRQFQFSPVQLTPRKLGFGCVITRELWEHSNAEALIGSVMAADLSLGIETLLFDAVAADTVRPAGLKNGIAAITADAGASGANDAMINDLANLATAVAPVSTHLAYVASPKQYVKIMLRKSLTFPFPVYASSALADRQVACIALDALAVGGNGEPRLEVGDAPTIVMDDAAGAFSTVGTPNVVAAPIQSTFQADLIAMKVIADISWALRSASGFSWTQNVNW